MFRTLKFVVVATTVSACSLTSIDHHPLPPDLVSVARVLNFETARTWADSFSPEFLAKERLRQSQIGISGLARSSMNILTLSGGGANGAFGAGYLAGWSARGDRPQFEIVSGISTGALIAPLAFLGPQYDDELEQFYTTVSTKDILRKDYIGGLLGGGAAITDSAPLARLIARFVTPKVLSEIADEHQKGRRLLIITTNIEAQRPVMWDMGEIAGNSSEEALELFRSVLLASASIPGAFPPVPIKVTAGQSFYTELHVDGGTTTNVFLAPLNVSLPDVRRNRSARLFVLRNGKLRPQYTPLKPTVSRIAGRAISTLLKSQTNGDIQRIIALARRNGFGFKMVSIPESFDAESKEPFDPEYMSALFDVGYDAGISGAIDTSDPFLF